MRSFWEFIPLSRNFSVHTNGKFIRVNIIETRYGRPRVYVKVEPRSSFTVTRAFSYIASFSFMHFRSKKNYVTVELT